MSSHSINSQIYRLAVNLALSCTMSDGVWYSIILYDEDRSRSRGTGLRSRLFPVNGSTTLPALTPWRLPMQTFIKHSKKPSASSSLGGWADRKRLKQQRINEKWDRDQRMRRRLWKGRAIEFKTTLDKSMDDPDGHESMWIEIQAKRGCRRWCWSCRRLKGAIEIEEPSGEVFLRGSRENQVLLLALIKEFTEEYHGRLPKMPASLKRQRFPIIRKASNTWAYPRGHRRRLG